MLDGAWDLLARRPPIWLLETFEDGVVERIRSFGYSAFVRDATGRLVEIESRIAGRNYWFFPIAMRD